MVFASRSKRSRNSERVRKMRRQNFDGDDAVQARVAGAVHLAHPARANGGEDFVGP